MKKHYDFSKSKKNPYSKHFKQQVTIRLDKEAIDYFRQLSEESGIPYQNLINLYLIECAEQKKKPSIKWKLTA